MQQQLLHAVVLLALGIWARQGGSRWLHLAALLLTLGVLLFSGLIYLRIFTGLEALRPSGALGRHQPDAGLAGDWRGRAGWSPSALVQPASAERVHDLE